MGLKKVLLLGIVGCCLVAVFLYAPKGTAKTVAAIDDSLAFDVESETEYWGRVIRTEGVHSAYLHLKEVYDTRPRIGHKAAHLFGDLAYAEEGPDAISVCDTAFDYGCFHQVVSNIVSDLGIEGVARLDAYCSRIVGTWKIIGCYHGVGHGTYEYFGEARLADALSTCASLQQSPPCEHGVFMQYSAPIDPTTTNKAKPFDQQNPYMPCDFEIVDERFRPQCYLTLPHWWFTDDTVSTRGAGDLCAAAPKEYRAICYQGISLDLPGRMQYDQSRVIAECESIADSLGARECLESSALRFESLDIEPSDIKTHLQKNWH